MQRIPRSERVLVVASLHIIMSRQQNMATLQQLKLLLDNLSSPFKMLLLKSPSSSIVFSAPHIIFSDSSIVTSASPIVTSASPNVLYSSLKSSLLLLKSHSHLLLLKSLLGEKNTPKIDDS